MSLRMALGAAIFLLVFAGACGSQEPESPKPAAAPAGAPEAAASTTPPDLARGLLVAISRFEKGEGGRPLPKSELMSLVRQGGAWKATSLEDPEAAVFHKALVWTRPGAEPAILTLAGSAPGGEAALKLWNGDAATTVWQAAFGGKFSRMRDAEIGDLYGDGTETLAVATHDQGVMAIVRPQADGSFDIEKIDEKPATFVHEVELGDLDGDGVLEVYATPSDPNKLDGAEQHGEVVRYVPAKGEGRVVVGDLGTRHAKEILVDDVDGDGTDELYVSIEAAEGGSLEIRRYDAGTDPTKGFTIAKLEDPMCRFLTAGDLDGDGKKEMVAAAKDTGLWLLRPGADPRGSWEVTLIDHDSKGFEHAALLADLDEDGTDELYVASDDDRELRRYVHVDGEFERETIYRRSGTNPVLTWNLTDAPAELLAR